METEVCLGVHQLHKVHILLHQIHPEIGDLGLDYAELVVQEGLDVVITLLTLAVLD